MADYPIIVIVLFRDMGTRGQFGDMFGAVNALFSGLAFAIIFSSLEVQRRQIQEQRMQSQQQVELAAMTACADITKALWEKNYEQFTTKQPHPDPSFWKNAMEVRYHEMMHGRSAFEKILKERSLL